MSYEDILYEEADHVATITINRPEVYNAFRAQTCEELIQAFRGFTSKMFNGFAQPIKQQFVLLCFTKLPFK